MNAVKTENEYKLKHKQVETGRETAKWEQQKRVTNTKVVNGVHPLHWAMSPGPSPMGTDPINGFKWYKWFWHQPRHLQKQNAVCSTCACSVMEGWVVHKM